MSDEKIDRIQIPKGTLIHIEGMPFSLESDTVVLGVATNLALFSSVRVTVLPDPPEEFQTSPLHMPQG